MWSALAGAVSHPTDREGLKQTFLKHSGKHIFADIPRILSEGKKKVTKLFKSGQIFALFRHSLHCGIFINKAHPTFLVLKSFEESCQICIAQLNVPVTIVPCAPASPLFLCSIEGQVLRGVLFSVRAIAETTQCPDNSRRSSQQYVLGFFFVCFQCEYLYLFLVKGEHLAFSAVQIKRSDSENQLCL